MWRGHLLKQMWMNYTKHCFTPKGDANHPALDAEDNETVLLKICVRVSKGNMDGVYEHYAVLFLIYYK